MTEFAIRQFYFDTARFMLYYIKRMEQTTETRQIRLYKYLSPKALASFVQNHSLKLSFGYETNDRFELLPGHMLPTNDAAARETQTPEMARHGFISLTRVEDNPYMWGYYADMYRGACLEFLFEVEVVKDEETDKNRYRRLDKESPELGKLRNIDRTCLDGNYIDICEYEMNRIDRVHNDVPAYARNLITNKHVTWSQEQEYRILYSTILRNGKENSAVKGVNTGEGIIYTTADINNCAVALKVGPFCAMQVADIRRGLNSDPVLRGIRVQRAQFEKCTYAVRFPGIEKGVYPMNGLGRSLFLSACRYGDKPLLENVFKKTNGALEDEDKYHYNGAAIALLRRSVACLDYLKNKNLKPVGLHGENLKNTVLWCASSEAESADYWLGELLELAKNDNEKWTTWTDKYGRNPLGVAARNGRLNCVEKLLSACESQKKSLLDAQDIEGRTPLMLAAWAKNIGIVKRLLKENPDLEKQDRGGASALIFAAASPEQDCPAFEKNSRVIVKLLLHCAKKCSHTDEERCCNFFTEDDTGWTALMYAKYAGYNKTADLLMKRFPKFIDRKNNEGLKAEYYARMHAMLSNMRTGLETYKKWEEFIQAKRKREDFDKIIHHMLYKASRLNAKTALKGIWDALEKEPINLNKHFNEGDEGGCTPLMWSITDNSDCSALDFLLEKLDPKALETQDNAGCNVLMWAARKGNKTALSKILEFISAREISPSDYLQNKDKNGMTALMWAAWKLRHGAVEAIMDKAEKYGCHETLLTQRDETGNTALDYAYKADSGEVPENSAGETEKEKAKRKTVAELLKWYPQQEEKE